MHTSNIAKIISDPPQSQYLAKQWPSQGLLLWIQEHGFELLHIRVTLLTTTGERRNILESSFLSLGSFVIIFYRHLNLPEPRILRFLSSKKLKSESFTQIIIISIKMWISYRYLVFQSNLKTVKKTLLSPVLSAASRNLRADTESTSPLARTDNMV